VAALRVSIVGAGIGGLATALALSADGHDVTCFERVSTLREIGAGIQISANGARILHRFGLAKALAPVAVLPVANEYRRWNTDERILRYAINPQVEAKFGAPHYCLHRADLHEILRAAVPAKSIRLASKCTGFSVTPAGRAVAHFEGAPDVESDVLIGADGIHSALRRALVGDPARFAGRHSIRALVPAARVDPELLDGPKSVLWLGPSRTLLMYPVSAGRYVNFAAFIPSDAERDESWTNEGNVEEVARAFDGWNPRLQSLLRAAERVLVLPLYDRPPVERWGEGPVTLLGDAAHPMLPFMGQGAVQAIEDAAVLARMLRGVAPDDAHQALRQYETKRRARTAGIQERAGASGWGRLIHLPDGEEQRERDAKFSQLTTDPNEHLFSYDPDLD
jgi:salicylate hydroxylase